MRTAGLAHCRRESAGRQGSIQGFEPGAHTGRLFLATASPCRDEKDRRHKGRKMSDLQQEAAKCTTK